MIIRLYKFLFILLFSSCVESFDFASSKPIVVLDGKVSTLPKRSYVKVYQSLENGEIINLTNLTIKVIDDSGREFPFIYDGDSLVNAYVPIEKTFKAVQGKSYKVEALNSNGTLYESSYDGTRKHIDFDLIIGDTTVVVPTADKQGFVRRKVTTATARLFSEENLVNSKLEFEYYYRDFFTSDTVLVKKEDDFVLFSCTNTSCSNTTDIPVGVTAQDGWYFIKKNRFCDSLSVKQTEMNLSFIENCERSSSCCQYQETWPTVFTIYLESVSETVYSFWEDVEKLSSNDGLVLDTYPFSIEGNVTCINCTEEVFGLFRSVSETVQSITIDL